MLEHRFSLLPGREDPFLPRSQGLRDSPNNITDKQWISEHTHVYRRYEHEGACPERMCFGSLVEVAIKRTIVLDHRKEVHVKSYVSIIIIIMNIIINIIVTITIIVIIIIIIIVTIIIIIVSITKFSMVIGSPPAYLSRWCPITVRFEVFVIGNL